MADLAADLTFPMGGTGFINIGTLADVWAQDLLQITFSVPMKNDVLLQSPRAYLVTPLDGGIPVTVVGVQTGSENGPIIIYIVITEPTVGKTYSVTFQSLYNIAGAIVDPILCKFIARPTKQDAVIRTRPELYDMTPDSTLRKVMSAIGRSDDIIGGARSDQFLVGSLADPPPPQIYSFTNNIPIGDQVTITGIYFTGTTSVFFGLIDAPIFTVVDDHHIVVTVPVGTIIAPIIVTTPAGVAVSSDFDPNPFLDAFVFDLSQLSLPSGIIATRTGGPMYLQSSASVVRQVAANFPDIWEDRGDGGGRGRWVMSGYTNEIVDPFDFTAMIESEQPYLLPGSDIGPDGATPSTLITDRHPDTFSGLSSPGTVSHPGSGDSSAYLIWVATWVKDIVGPIPPTRVDSIFDNTYLGTYVPPGFTTPQETGNQFTVTAPTKVLGLTAYRYASEGATTRQITLWNVDTPGIVAQGNTPTESGTGWVTYLLPTPVTLVPGTNYAVTLSYVAGVGIGYQFSGPFTTGNVNFVQGRYVLTPNTFPTIAIGAWYTVDIIGVDVGDFDAFPNIIGGITPAFGASAYGGNISAAAGWRRAVSAWYINGFGPTVFGNYGLYPSGMGPLTTSQNLYTPSHNAIGGYKFWGASMIGGYVDKPMVIGTTGDTRLTVDPPRLSAALDDNGDFHILVSFLADATGVGAVATFALFSADFPEGNFDIIYSSQTVMSAQLRGVPAGMSGASVNIGQLPPHSELRAELGYMPNTTGQAFMQFWNNGCRSSSLGTYVGATLGTLSPPTAFRIGRDPADGQVLDRRFTFVARADSVGRGDKDAAEYVVLGDSLITYTAVLEIPTLIYTLMEARTRPGIVDFSFPGETTVIQRGKWQASAQRGRPDIKVVFDASGINDINLGATAPATLASMQATINDVFAFNPTANFYRYQLLPSRSALGPIVYAKWLAVNTGIAGGGGTPLTGTKLVASIAVRPWPALNDGNDNLAAWADNGDALHENNAARMYIAAVFRADLQANGDLPGGLAPTFVSKSVSSGTIGATVIVTGTNLASVVSASFSGVAVLSMIPISATQTSLVVPPSTPLGPGTLLLSTPLGTANCGTFTVV